MRIVLVVIFAFIVPNYLRELISANNLPNLLLFIAGLGGIAVGIYTLRDIRAQTQLLGEYVTATKDGVEATRKAAEAASDSAKIQAQTVILQYRPKIIVRNAKALNFSVDLGKPWECEIRLQIVNIGGSPAYITAGSYIQIVSSIGHDMRKIEIKWGDECPVSPVTLGPGQGITVEECLTTGVLFDLEWENSRQGLPVKPFRYVGLVGVIYYADDLSIPRSTGISREFDARTDEFTPKKQSEQEYSD
jgi:hypothetical protein